MAWLRNIVITIVVFSVGLAAWKIWGGDVGSFVDTLWNVFYSIGDALSNVIVTAWETVFGTDS